MVRNKIICMLIFFCVLPSIFTESQNEDRFYVSEKNHDNLVYTYILDDVLVRKEYDTNKRLIKKIQWDIETETQILSVLYSYKDDSMFPFYSETVYPLDSVKEKRKYSEIGQEILIQSYSHDILVYEKEFSYDEQNRITCYTERNYEKTEDGNQKSKLQYQVQYEYVTFDSKKFTNEYYFENDIKTGEKIYLSSTKYYENTFFQDDIRIYSEYEDGKKNLEITYFQEKEVRRK